MVIKRKKSEEKNKYPKSFRETPRGKDTAGEVKNPNVAKKSFYKVFSSRRLTREMRQ